MNIDGPNKEKVLQLISEIEAIDLRTAAVGEIQELIRTLITGFPTSAIKMAPGQYVHRTRVCEKPENIRQVTYPPANVTPIGRANEQGKPRFYGSIGRGVPFFELNPQVGDKIALSTWKTTKDMLLNRVAFTKENSVSLESKRDLENIYSSSDFLEKLSESQLLVNSFLAKWLVKRIGKDEPDFYKVTAAMSNMLMAGDLFAGLVYPTVKMFGNADNLVLDPVFVDNSLRLVSVEYFEITESAGDCYKIELLDTAVKWDEKGNVEWTGKELGWNCPGIAAVHMKSENGEWVNLDDLGNRIDPIPTNPIWRNLTPVALKYKNCYPSAAKASVDYFLKGPQGDVAIKSSIVFDLEKREKFIAFYIPRGCYAFHAAKALGNAYNQIMENTIKDVKQFISSKADGSDEIRIDGFPDGKMIHFFSEEYIDIDELGKQIAAGYRLVLECQDRKIWAGPSNC